MEQKRTSSHKPIKRFNSRQKHRFSPSFLHKSGANLPLSSRPLKQTRHSALSHLLSVGDKSPVTRTPLSQSKSARKKLVSREGRDESDKPIIGVGFGDLGPVSSRLIRRVPVSMLRYAHDRSSYQADSLGSLLSFQSHQLSYDRASSVLRNYSRERTSGRGMRDRRKSLGKVMLTPSRRKGSPKSVDEDNLDRGNIESSLGEWEAGGYKREDSAGLPGQRRVILEKRWTGQRPVTAYYACDSKEHFHKHSSEAKLSHRLFQNDSLQAFGPNDEKKKEDL